MPNEDISTPNYDTLLTTLNSIKEENSKLKEELATLRKDIGDVVEFNKALLNSGNSKQSTTAQDSKAKAEQALDKFIGGLR